VGLPNIIIQVMYSSGRPISPDPLRTVNFANAFTGSNHALLKTNTENSKQIFPEERNLRGHIPSFHIRVSVSDLYMPTIDLPILLYSMCVTACRNTGSVCQCFHCLCLF
jgi:hypothetical protein